MKKSLLMFVVLVLSACSAVMAQTVPDSHGPPKVLYIVREDIKPGMMPAHTKHSANFVSIFGKLQTPNYRIALVPVAGSENEVVYLTGANTFAELEGMLQATDKKWAPRPVWPKRISPDFKVRRRSCTRPCATCWQFIDPSLVLIPV